MEGVRHFRLGPWCANRQRRRELRSGPFDGTTGFRIELGGEGQIRRVDIDATGDRAAPPLHDLRGQLVTHDGQRVALGRAHQRTLFERREHLLLHLLARPPLLTVEVRERLLAIDPLYEIRAHVFVLEAERVARFVADHATEFGLGSAGREALQVQGRLVFRDLQDFRADVGPIARHLRGAVETRDTHFTDSARLRENHVRGLIPRVHVREDLLAESLGWIVEKRNAEANARGRPFSCDQHGDATDAAAPSRRSSPYRPALGRVGRIDLDSPPFGGGETL